VGLLERIISCCGMPSFLDLMRHLSRFEQPFWVNLFLFYICQDGTFKLTMEFSEEYPNKPPVVKFLSKMFHPNIYADGGICLDILQNRWSPTYDVSAILTSIQSLVKDMSTSLEIKFFFFS